MREAKKTAMQQAFSTPTSICNVYIRLRFRSHKLKNGERAALAKMPPYGASGLSTCMSEPIGATP